MLRDQSDQCDTSNGDWPPGSLHSPPALSTALPREHHPWVTRPPATVGRCWGGTREAVTTMMAVLGRPGRESH